MQASTKIVTWWCQSKLQRYHRPCYSLRRQALSCRWVFFGNNIPQHQNCAFISYTWIQHIITNSIIVHPTITVTRAWNATHAKNSSSNTLQPSEHKTASTLNLINNTVRLSSLQQAVLHKFVGQWMLIQQSNTRSRINTYIYDQHFIDFCTTFSVSTPTASCLSFKDLS